MPSDITYHGPVVAFDLDDTLYSERDFVASGMRAAGDMLAAKYGRSVAWGEMLVAAFERGANAFDSIDSELRRFGSSTAEELPALLDAYRFHTPEIALRADARRLLDALQQKGVRMALITDGRARTQRAKIEALGLNTYIAPDCIFISEEVGAEKISGEAMAAVVRMFPEASGFTYIGDNPAKDFYAANRLGWRTICLADDGRNIHAQQLKGGLYDAQLIVGTLAEVEGILY